MPTMPAAIGTALKEMRCDEIPIPEPEPGKVLVKTALAVHMRLRPAHLLHGLERYEWPLPHGYPGHEGVGVVLDGGGTGSRKASSFSPPPTSGVPRRSRATS